MDGNFGVKASPIKNHPGFVKGQPIIDEFPYQRASNVDTVSMPKKERWQPSFIAYTYMYASVNWVAIGSGIFFWVLFSIKPFYWSLFVEIVTTYKDDDTYALRRLISLTTQLYVQQLVRAYNKENTNAPHQCSCLRGIHLSLEKCGFPLLITSNSQIVYMSWRDHEMWRKHVYESVNWFITGSSNGWSPVICQTITLTIAISFLWNKIH